MSDRNRIGSVSERNWKRIPPKFLKCDVKKLTNSIQQSDEPELRRRRKELPTNNAGDTDTIWQDDMTTVCDEILKPANEYRNHRIDVTKTRSARMPTQNLPTQGAAGRQKNGDQTNGDSHPDRQEWGGKLAMNEAARKYGTRRSRGRKMTQRWRRGRVWKDARRKYASSKNKRCQTAQAVKVWHPQTENWRGLKESTRGASKKKEKVKFGNEVTHATVDSTGRCVANDAA